FTALVVASTGADCAAALSAAVGALSGALHGGAAERALPMLGGGAERPVHGCAPSRASPTLEAAAELGDADRYVAQLLDRGERLMGFGHRVYRAEDPRARVLRRTAQKLGAPRYEGGAALW